MFLRSHLDNLDDPSIFVSREGCHAFSKCGAPWSMRKDSIDKAIHPTKQSLSL
jgi:hypothetical protein